jgi:maltooligosyltrehalose trehalohydrolase
MTPLVGFGRSPGTAPVWQPSFGFWPHGKEALARVWAPGASRVDLQLEDASTSQAAPGSRLPTRIPLVAEADGFFGAFVEGIVPGTRYRFALGDERPIPDPASRSQPDGVHGASEFVDPSAFEWRHAPPTRVRMDDLVVYELHVGTFTPEGTFAAAAERFRWLADLGVTAIELMPVASFPGTRNWGYDGAALFAPAAVYGRPDDLRRLVDEAHAVGVLVLLDVVYNHLGPDGAYAAAASPRFFSNRHLGPWGRAVNLDGPDAVHVRRFFIENALHWLVEYRFDGLRLDATHAFVDESREHFLAELSQSIRQATGERDVLLIAEDHRNLRTLLLPHEAGGWGLDGVWADDFHHIVRRLVAGDDEGYYRDFAGTSEELAQALRRGWLYTGERSVHHGAERGTSPEGLPLERFVVCLQNHDQVGNRPIGDRLHHSVDPATWRAASVLLLMAPETPLLFMGQEWAASSPFLYFTDHEPWLGRLVREGRRVEFRHFKAFADPDLREQIPDPQSPVTFERSRLVWTEVTEPPHAGTLALYRHVLAIRRLLAPPEGPSGALAPDAIGAAGPGGLWMRRRLRDGGHLLVVLRLSGGGPVPIPAASQSPSMGPRGWVVRLDTEDSAFVGSDSQPAIVRQHSDAADVLFARPGAVILERGST